MVAYAEIKQLSFQYANEERPALSSVSLSVEQGEFVVLAGRSGCGKTTLLKHFKKELQPIGMRTGELFYNQMQLKDVPSITSAQEIGMVFQNPENQLVMDTVIQELAFSLENIGCSTTVIQKRIAELISFLGFQDLVHQSVHTLSGGQKQLVNLAAVLILQPKLLLLDEPTAQLDPIAAKEFLTLLKRIHEELGMTIIVSEHRLDDILPLADRLVFMDGGSIICEGTPKEVVEQLWVQEPFRSYIPQIPRLFLEWGSEDVPFTVRDGQKTLPVLAKTLHPLEKTNPRQGKELLRAQAITFQYEKNGVCILDDLSFSVQQGEWVALVGKNGTGKSTLLTVLAGLQKSRRGKVFLDGERLDKIPSAKRYKQIGYVSQQPYYHFTHDTVWEELYNRAQELGYEHSEQAAREMMERFSLSFLSGRHPHDCSGGEQQLIAICTVLLSNPRILLLDEPTKGLDPEKKEKLGELFQQLQQDGTTILMATHDVEFAARFVNRCVLLFDGQIIAEDTPRRFFSENFFYTTAVNRLVRKQLPEALIWEDVVQSCPSGLLSSL